jgi:hypothetical protein
MVPVYSGQPEWKDKKRRGENYLGNHRKEELLSACMCMCRMRFSFFSFFPCLFFFLLLSFKRAKTFGQCMYVSSMDSETRKPLEML